MATSIRRASGGKSPRLAGPSAESAALADKPFLRFHHSAPLRRKTLSVVYVLEQAENPVAHADELANLVVELTNAGLDAYFMQPLKLAKPGFVVEQSASLGMVGVQQVMGTVIRPLASRLHELRSARSADSNRPFCVTGAFSLAFPGDNRPQAPLAPHHPVEMQSGP
jgi:hypothetical protein